MIAEHGERTIRRIRQRREQLGDRSDELAIDERDVVAAEHDQSGRLCEHRHRARHVVGGDRLAVVHVGDQPDPKAVERGWKTGHRDVVLVSTDAMALVRDAVGAGAGAEPDIAVADRALSSASRREMSIRGQYS